MKTDMDEVAAELGQHLELIRACVNPQDDTPEDYAMGAIETFCAVALRVLKKSNPSKVRDAAMTVEIKARMDGTPVVRGLDA